ncbi:ankyrin repeat-containing protein At5g02620-like, partial [Fagus crenata]
VPLEPLIHFIRYHLGYLPSLEGVAISEIKEAHDQETGNEPSSEGEGKVESSTAKIEGNDDEKEKHVALAPNLKAQESVHKEEYSNEILASISLTIATIIATVTFQAACQIPGGYKENGQPNLSSNSSFRAFLLYDSVSFGLSAFLMCFHFVVAIFPQYFHIPYPRLLIFILSELSLMSMIAAFISIINTQNSATDAVNMGTYLAFFIPFFPFLLVFYAHFCVKHISKYRFPFFSSSFHARH